MTYSELELNKKTDAKIREALSNSLNPCRQALWIGLDFLGHARKNMTEEQLVTRIPPGTHEIVEIISSHLTGEIRDRLVGQQLASAKAGNEEAIRILSGSGSDNSTGALSYCQAVARLVELWFALSELDDKARFQENLLLIAIHLRDISAYRAAEQASSMTMAVNREGLWQIGHLDTNYCRQPLPGEFSAKTLKPRKRLSPLAKSPADEGLELG